jgi:HAD superfamily hydrolase (TIGR01509 family)
MTAPELVIFDCDGVLVDSEPISSRILAASLNQLGLPVSPEEARRSYLGPRLSEIVARVEGEIGCDLDPEWLIDFEARRAEAFRRELRLIDGAEQAVACVSAAGIAVCVASQARLENTRLRLEATGLNRFFPESALFSAEQVQMGKPWPDLFLHAAHAMGVDPRRCAVVEDTPRGVSAAVRAGMRALGFAGAGDVEELRRAGAEVLTSLDVLPALLEVTY